MIEDIIQAVSILAKYVKKLKSNKKLKSVSGRVLFNLSGHPLSEKAEAEFKQTGINTIVNVEIPTIDYTPSSVVNSAVEIAKEMCKKALKQLLTGDFLIILPGYTPLAATLISIIHGIAGHFPNITFLARKDSVFMPAGNINLQALRTEMRTLR